MKKYDVILFGNYSCDLSITGLPDLPALGTEIYGNGFEIVPGDAFILSLTLQRLGVNTGWVSDFGTDFFSQFILRAAKREGLDTSLFRYHDFPLRLVSVA